MPDHALEFPSDFHHLQAAQAIADLIVQHSAWESAGVILHKCALQLPAGTSQLPARLESSLASVEVSVPTREPQVISPQPSHS